MTSDHAPSHAHAESHHGPSIKTYIVVAVALTLITAVEVAIYYYDPIKKSAMFVPTLLVLSAIKFFTVVGFYMHLKYDHKIFRGLFGGPFLIAIGTITALLFLFGKVAGGK